MTLSVIRARTVITDAESTPLSEAAVVINDGQIVAVSPWNDVRTEVGIVTEVDGVLMPGMIDAHSHLRGVPLGAHGIPARPFESWICSLGAMASLDAHDEAVVAGAELLETGVTSVQGFVDCGAHEPSALEHPTRTVEGLTAAGIRALVILGFADRALRTPEPAEGDWATVIAAPPGLPVDALGRVAQRWLGQKTAPTVSLGIGPVGAQWSTDALLTAIAAAAGGARTHTHLHESRLHRSWIAGAASPLDRLDQFGLLGEHLSGAHAVHLTASELDRITASGASLVHCPISNAALQVGTAQVGAWLERGIPCGLGVDSQNDAAPDMFEVIRAATRNGATAHQAFAMATTGGARALGLAGGGRIAVGSPADLVELGVGYDTVERVVDAAAAKSVQRVWVGGTHVVTGGRSVADVSAAVARLDSQLAADLPDRERRLAQQAPTVDLVERLAGAMT